MIENIVFCAAFALQIFAWVLAGGKFGFRPRNNNAKPQEVWYNSLLFRRVYLCIGAGVVAVYAYCQHDYVLLAGQGILFVILWFRVSMTGN